MANKPPVSTSNNNHNVGVSVSQGKRGYHEDRHVIIENLYEDFSLYGVFDGHGGSDVADACVSHLPNMIRAGLEHLFQQSGIVNQNLIKEMLYHTFLILHDELLQPSTSFTCGSTCLLVLRRRNQMWVANSGDSRAILGLGRLMGGRAHTVVNLTRDHKPGTVSEKQRIEAAGGYVRDVMGVPRVIGELAVSRSIGDKRYHPYVIPHPDVMYYTLNPGSTHSYLVLATDGLWDVMNSDEVGDFVVDSFNNRNNSQYNPSETMMDASRCATSIMRHAYERLDAEDNMTILVIIL